MIRRVMRSEPVTRWLVQATSAYDQWLKRANAVGLRGWQPLVLLGLVGLSVLGVIGGAALGSLPVFLISALVGLLVDLVADGVLMVQRLLERAYLGLPERSMIREFALLLLFTRLGMPDGEISWAALLVFLVILARTFVILVDRQATELQMPKVSTRNFSIAEVEESTPVSPLGLPVLVAISSAPLFGGLVTAYTGSILALLIATGVYAILAVSWSSWRLYDWVSTSRKLNPQDVMTAASEEIASMRPEVLVYFSGPTEALYQLEMWLPVLEKLDRRVLVFLRERPNLAALKDTTLPVVCIPNPNDTMDFRLPTVRVAFYVAHVGKNIHMMREPRMKHVFIGHGESDKVSSVNPISKGYDEVWVAGRASRERWAAAKVGVRDDAIVEVGRPQLGGILRAATAQERAGRPFSVLYAPTWEGWVNDPHASSLMLMGPTLVQFLIDRPDTRVIYKPHPFTGKVSPLARKAHAEIAALIESSGGRNLSNGPADQQAWVDAVGDNLIVDGPEPTLYTCFNRSDALLGDISSVVPDFLASGKPYFIPNTRGLDHQELRDSSASARAAYLLDPEPQSWEASFADATGDDSLSESREELREFLLGPYYVDPIEPWRIATVHLIDRANAEWPDAEAEVAALGRE